MAEVSIKEAFKRGKTFNALAKFKNTQEALDKKAYTEGIRLKLMRIIPEVYSLIADDSNVSLNREAKQMLDLASEAGKMRNDAGRITAQIKKVEKEIQKLDKICEGSIERIRLYLKYVFTKVIQQSDEEQKVIKTEAVELYGHIYYWSGMSAMECDKHSTILEDLKERMISQAMRYRRIKEEVLRQYGEEEYRKVLEIIAQQEREETDVK